MLVVVSWVETTPSQGGRQVRTGWPPHEPPSQEEEPSSPEPLRSSSISSLELPTATRGWALPHSYLFR